MHPVRQGELRWTVAVWEDLDDDRLPWRLDRVLSTVIQDRSPVFELVDEECQSHLLDRSNPLDVSPIWLEWVDQPDPSRRASHREWFLTERWDEICEARGGSRPVELRDRMLGIAQVLEPTVPLVDAFHTEGDRSARWIFTNRKGGWFNWLFLPLRIDQALFDAADQVDRELPSVHVPDERKAEVLGRLLGRPTEPMGDRCRSSPATFFSLEPFLGGGDVLPLTHSSFQPRWSAILQGRSIGGPTFLSMLKNLENHGVAYRPEKWDEWARKNVLAPKLLLDQEEVEIFALLGERLPLLWPDPQFREWAVAQEDSSPSQRQSRAESRGQSGST